MSNCALPLDAIEHLDHSPACGQCDNPAEFWCEAHGCDEGLLCGPCVIKERKKFENGCCLASTGCVGCSHCKRPFNNFATWMDVVPL